MARTVSRQHHDCQHGRHRDSECEIGRHAASSWVSGRSVAYLSVEHVQSFSRQYFQERLNEAYELAEDIPTDPAIDRDFEIEDLKENVEDYRKSLHERQYSQYVQLQAQEMLDRLKPPHIKISPDILSAACEAVVRAEIEKRRYMIAMLTGNPADSAPVDPLFVGMMPTGYPPIRGALLGLDSAER